MKTTDAMKPMVDTALAKPRFAPSAPVMAMTAPMEASTLSAINELLEKYNPIPTEKVKTFEESLDALPECLENTVWLCSGREYTALCHYLDERWSTPYAGWEVLPNSYIDWALAKVDSFMVGSESPDVLALGNAIKRRLRTCYGEKGSRPQYDNKAHDDFRAWNKAGGLDDFIHAVKKERKNATKSH